MEKIRVGILFGGRSGEHEVSLLSTAPAEQDADSKFFHDLSVWTCGRLAVNCRKMMVWILRESASIEGGRGVADNSNLFPASG